jgi:dTMP kinase
VAARRGRFITLEGGEGAGKSTHVRRLSAWLAERGVAVVQTREPGGSPRAEAIRELLLSGRAAPFGTEAEAVLFAVARADHMEETVRPALRRGEWVVCDRFIDSTRAYQGSAGVAPELLDRLEAVAIGPDRPDLTLILDLPAAEGLERADGRGGVADRFEDDALSVHESRRAAFLAIAKREPERCVVIDARQDVSAVSQAVKEAVADRLGAFLP